MPKVKRRKKKQHPSVNWKRGLIPWSYAEYQEVLQQLIVRTSNPIDHREVQKRGVILLGENGEEEEIKINPSSLFSTTVNVIHEKYGHDLHTYMAHVVRFDKMHEFIQKHRGVLIETGLVKNGSDDTMLISTELLEALCILPYSQRVRVKDWIDYEFSYSEVMAKCGSVAQGVPRCILGESEGNEVSEH